MASMKSKPQDAPMAVRMQRVLDSVKRMSPSDRVNLLVRAGLLPESEAQQAIDRLASAEKDRRKPKVRRSGPAKKAAKQTDG